MYCSCSYRCTWGPFANAAPTLITRPPDQACSTNLTRTTDQRLKIQSVATRVSVRLTSSDLTRFHVAKCQNKHRARAGMRVGDFRLACFKGLKVLESRLSQRRPRWEDVQKYLARQAWSVKECGAAAADHMKCKFLKLVGLSSNVYSSLQTSMEAPVGWRYRRRPEEHGRTYPRLLNKQTTAQFPKLFSVEITCCTQFGLCHYQTIHHHVLSHRETAGSTTTNK